MPDARPFAVFPLIVILSGKGFAGFIGEQLGILLISGGMVKNQQPGCPRFSGNLSGQPGGEMIALHGPFEVAVRKRGLNHHQMGIGTKSRNLLHILLGRSRIGHIADFHSPFNMSNLPAQLGQGNDDLALWVQRNKYGGLWRNPLAHPILESGEPRTGAVAVMNQRILVDSYMKGFLQNKRQ